MSSKYDGSFSVKTYTRAWAQEIRVEMVDVYPLQIAKSVPGAIVLESVNRDFEWHRNGLQDLREPLLKFDKVVRRLQNQGTRFDGPNYLFFFRIWERDSSDHGKIKIPLEGFPNCFPEQVHIPAISSTAERDSHDSSPGGKVSTNHRCILLRRRGLLHYNFRLSMEKLLGGDSLLDQVFACMKHYHG